MTWTQYTWLGRRYSFDAHRPSEPRKQCNQVHVPWKGARVFPSSRPVPDFSQVPLVHPEGGRDSFRIALSSLVPNHGTRDYATEPVASRGRPWHSTAYIRRSDPCVHLSFYEAVVLNPGGRLTEGASCIGCEVPCAGSSVDEPFLAEFPYRPCTDPSHPTSTSASYCTSALFAVPDSRDAKRHAYATRSYALDAPGGGEHHLHYCNLHRQRQFLHMESSRTAHLAVEAFVTERVDRGGLRELG